MAKLSNINGKFAVEDTGAIRFSDQTGTTGQILKSNGNSAPTWVDPNTVGTGPWLPLAGGIVSGATTFQSSLTIGGTAVFNGDMTLPAAADHFLIGAGSLQTTGRIKFGLPSWNNSIGLESYWMVMRSNSNEGYKFIDSGGNTYVQFNAGTNSSGANYSYFKGRIGIGTISPDAKLTIGDPGGATTRSIQIEGNTSVSGMNGTIGYFSKALYISNNYYYNSAQVHPISTYGQTNIVQQTSTVTGGNFIDFNVSDHTDPNNAPDTRMRILDSGNVGIGTTSPSRKLVVAQSNVTEPSGIDANTSILIKNNTWSGIQMLATEATGNFITFGDNVNGFAGRIQYSHATNAMQFETVGAERMRIDSSGNVKIGNPSVDHGYKLQIEGNNIMLNTEGSQQAKLIYARYSSNFTIQCDSEMRFNTGGSPSQKMVIQAGGNVGIGVTGPLTKMQINGCLAIGSAIYDGNITRTFTNFSQQAGGSLHINIGLGGGATSGDTITFEYAAVSWKSWSLSYNFASTNGISYGVVGGYWNNSGTSQNQTQQNNLGVSVAVTHNGQSNLITFTFTALGVHAMANFVYMQSGGDGEPIASRVTITANS